MKDRERKKALLARRRPGWPFVVIVNVQLHNTT